MVDSSLSSGCFCATCHIQFTSRNKLFKHIRYEHNKESVNSTDIDISSASRTSNKLMTIQIIDESKYCMVILKPQGMATMGIAPRHTGTRKDKSVVSVRRKLF